LFFKLSFSSKKAIVILKPSHLYEKTHSHTDRFIMSLSSPYGRSVLYSDHAFEEAVSKLYMAISKTWPFFLQTYSHTSPLSDVNVISFHMALVQENVTAERSSTPLFHRLTHTHTHTRTRTHLFSLSRSLSLSRSYI